MKKLFEQALKYSSGVGMDRQKLTEARRCIEIFYVFA